MSVFAAAVRTDEMRPRMHRGESVAFRTDHVASTGDDVLIVMQDGKYIIRELLATDEQRVVVRTYTPDVTAEVPRASVAQIFPIVARYFECIEELAADQTEDHHE